MIDLILGVTMIGLNITGVGLLTTIIAATAMTGIEAVAIIIGLLKVLGKQARNKCSLKAKKHEKIEMLAFTILNRISGLISKALNDNIISDEEYAQILLQFEIFTMKKEEFRATAKINLSKVDKEETEAAKLLRENTNAVKT